MRRELDRIFTALERAKVRTVVVGGLAVNWRGHLRMTIDVDLVVDLAPDSARGAVEVMVGLGYRPSVPVDPHDFSDTEVRRSWVESRRMLVLSWFHPDDPLSVVDLFTASPLPFEPLWTQAAPIAPDLEWVRVASIADLIRMKRASGRPRDLEDVQALEAIEREGNGS
jgi:hypothetical protein